MTVFVDTSAFYAVFDRMTGNTPLRKRHGFHLLDGADALFTHNYVLVETAALFQHRLGVAAVRTFHEDVVPLLAIDWITEERHRAGLEAVLAAGRKKLSLVDCISFQTMRANGIRRAFCFDAHFAEQGFTIHQD